MDSMEQLRDVSDFEQLLKEPLAIVFKHSATCGISAQADREVRSFLSDHPDYRVHLVDVQQARPVSNHIETATGVRHESPQVLVFRGGELVWHQSHGGVTAAALAETLS